MHIQEIINNLRALYLGEIYDVSLIRKIQKNIANITTDADIYQLIEFLIGVDLEASLSKSLLKIICINPVLTWEQAEMLSGYCIYEILCNPAFDFWILENPNFLEAIMPFIEWNSLSCKKFSNIPDVFKSYVVKNQMKIYYFLKGDENKKEVNAFHLVYNKCAEVTV